MVRTALAALAAVACCWLVACSAFDTPEGDNAGLVGGPPLYKTEPEIRVRIRNNVQRASIAGPSRFVVRPLGSSGTPDLVDGPLTITGDAGLLRIAGPTVTREFPPGMDVEILPRITSDTASSAPKTTSSASTKTSTPTKTATDSNLLKLDNTPYPGSVILRADSAVGTFNAIAVMPVEAYLPGVLVKELWGSFPKAAFEAQAVASRSYALHERDRARREGRAYDVDASTTNQVYGGSTTLGVANRAVEETRGIVMIDEGKILRAYFSSTCGGRPASASDTWPTSGLNSFNKAPGLQAHRRDWACNSSKWYRWQAVRTDDELSQRIRAWGRANGSPVGQIARLRGIKVDDRNDADRPTKFTLTDDRAKTYSISSEDLRRACNQEVPGLAALTEAQIVRSGDLEAEVWADRVNIRGRGFGHGVGLCQWCAKGFADRKLHYQEILTRFYSGVQLKRAY